jgi:dihydrofolate reductase
MSNRSLTLFIAASLDGYIAKPNDNLDFLSIVAADNEDYGYSAFVNSVDTVIMGRKTYDWVMKQVPEFPHADKESYIITRTARPSIGQTNFYTGDLKTLVQELKAKEGKTIYCDGGAELVNALLKENLIDEIILSIIPILLGEGTRLFQDQRPEQLLHLAECKSYKSGLVQLHYKRQS